MIEYIMSTEETIFTVIKTHGQKAPQSHFDQLCFLPFDFSVDYDNLNFYNIKSQLSLFSVF